MSFLNSVASYIQTNNLGTQGTNLFIGFLPTASTLQVVLTEYQGEVVETLRTGTQTSLKRSNMQVMVHGAKNDYSTPETRIIAIQNLLTAMPESTISGIKILRIRPIGTLNALGQNENQEFEFTANFEVIHE